MYIDVTLTLTLFWSVMVLLGTGEQFSHYGWTIGDIFNNAALETASNITGKSYNEIVGIMSKIKVKQRVIQDIPYEVLDYGAGLI